MYNDALYFFLLLLLTWVSGQLARISINPTNPEVNDYISL